MGADLYIGSVWDKTERKTKPKFEAAVAERDAHRGAANECEKLAASVLNAMVESTGKPIAWEDPGTKGVLNSMAEKSRQELTPITFRPSAVRRLVQAQAKVNKHFNSLFSEKSGYFRDSYNEWNMLNRLGISWWQDVAKMLVVGSDGCEVLGVEAATAILRRIEATPMRPLTPEEVKKIVDDNRNANLAGAESESPGEVQDFYVAKREELIRFLKRAIKLKEPIRCSL
ncbi:MAG: hypothetical protein IT443_12025 [Phycisphaeraceae bacterium]|nr:hypothetical protein [Phycisphaeraceae bacterium]